MISIRYDFLFLARFVLPCPYAVMLPFALRSLCVCVYMFGHTECAYPIVAVFGYSLSIICGIFFSSLLFRSALCCLLLATRFSFGGIFFLFFLSLTLCICDENGVFVKRLRFTTPLLRLILCHTNVIAYEQNWIVLIRVLCCAQLKLKL